MMRPRWAAVIAMLFVLVWAATAHAECAWDAHATVYPVRDSIGGIDLP